LRANPFSAITAPMPFIPITPSDIAPGTTRFVQHEGAAFLVARGSDGSIHALDGLCSHALLPLAGARLRRGHVICPHHGARFDVATGAAKGPPAHCGVAHYPAQEKDGMIELDLTP
jgi:3-phenylpropionate/trans-cinnamate dioxygenase ferredoxin subunit